MKLLLALLLALPCCGQHITIFVALSRLLQSGATTGQAITWNGTAYAAAVYGTAGTFSAATSVTVAHNLNLTYVKVQVWNNSNLVIQPKDITRTSANSVVVTFDAATSGRIVVK